MDIKCYIDGVAYTLVNNYSISQQSGCVSSSNIEVLVECQPIPTTFMAVELKYNDVTFFNGIIQTVQSPSFSFGYEVMKYKLTVLSIETIFNNRLVSETYQDKFTHEIVSDLFTKYIEPERITLGTISTSDQKYDDYNCSFTRLSDILDELAKQINASYYIDNNKRFNFVTRDTFIEVDIPEQIKRLQKNEEYGEIRSVQIVTGASEETSSQTESIIYNGSSIVLGYNVMAVAGITINATPAGIGVRGVDEDDTSKTFLWEFGSNNISINSNATVKPVTNDIIVVVYAGFYDIVITKYNDGLISELAEKTGGTGIIENIYTDESLKSYNDADLVTSSLLDQYSEVESDIQCVCLDLNASSLYNIWSFNYPELNITGQYVIVERTITDYLDYFTINVKLKNKNFFSKYGTVLKKESKKVGKDVKVYKESQLKDIVHATEAITIENAGIIYWTMSNGFFDQLWQNNITPMGG